MTKTIAEIFGAYDFDYEHIWIDNASTDGSQEKLRELCTHDPRIKVILNRRNFGHIRSPYHGFLQASGDAVVTLSADFQDPPQYIRDFIERWEAGAECVVGIKAKVEENFLLAMLRSAYYRIQSAIAEGTQLRSYTGFGLFDRKVVDQIKRLDEPYPYFRGIVGEIGIQYQKVPYEKPRRERGSSKNNIFTLFDLALLGIVSHSVVPLRLATFAGTVISIISFMTGLTYLFRKLLDWHSFTLGTAPLMSGLFFIGGLILLCIGIIGEYIILLCRRSKNYPHVFEKERINF